MKCDIYEQRLALLRDIRVSQDHRFLLAERNRVGAKSIPAKALNRQAETRRIRAENVFQDRVLFLNDLGFITPTDARKITREETVRFERIHEQTYRDLGFEITLIEPGSVPDRVKQFKHVL